MPLNPGMRTSSTRQPGPSGRWLTRNSRAELKLCTLSPAERSRRSVERRTEGSSSTTNTTASASVMLHQICCNDRFEARRTEWKCLEQMKTVRRSKCLILPINQALHLHWMAQTFADTFADKMACKKRECTCSNRRE